jgi:multicomponent Na+:H+ antiporter subunit D
MVEQLPAIIIVTPLAISFIVFITGWRYTRFAYPLAMLAMAICLISSIAILYKVVEHGIIQYWLGGWQPPWGIEYRIDRLNAIILCLVSCLGFIAAVYAKESVRKELPGKISQFWCLYLLLITGLLGIAITGDMFNLFVLLEVSSLSSYALVAIGKNKATLAGFRYLIIGTIGASFYLLGVGYLYISTGTLNMSDLQQVLPSLYDSRVVKTAFVFILIGFAIKIALFPFHAWQPDAYTYAPSVVSVIISTAAAKTYIYALIRIIFSVFTVNFFKASLSMVEVICWMAVIAMLSGSILAIQQDNLKRMLAYSSVANVGYIVLAIGLAPSTSLGLTPAVIHILNHAIIKGSMFMAACAFIHKLDLWDIHKFVGLGRQMPYSCMVLIIGALAMIGMPPSAGFVSKWYLILASLEAGRYMFVVIIFVSTLLMIVYFWRVIEILYIRSPKTNQGPDAHEADDVPLSMLLPSLFLGLLTFVFGMALISGFFSTYLDTMNAGFGLGRVP